MSTSVTDGEVDKSRKETSCVPRSEPRSAFALGDRPARELAMSFDSSKSGICRDIPDVSASRMVERSESFGDLSRCAEREVS